LIGSEVASQPTLANGAFTVERQGALDRRQKRSGEKARVFDRMGNGWNRILILYPVNPVNPVPPPLQSDTFAAK
jgi:hypothetical protein